MSWSQRIIVLGMLVLMPLITLLYMHCAHPDLVNQEYYRNKRPELVDTQSQDLKVRAESRAETLLCAKGFEGLVCSVTMCVLPGSGLKT